MAFFTAWASVDSVHSGAGSYLTRCASLVTATLRRQLTVDQPPSAEWQAMRGHHLVSLVHVQAVTYAADAPRPTPARVYLRVYAKRITVSGGRDATVSDGITLQLTRTGGRWLVARLLFW